MNSALRCEVLVTFFQEILFSFFHIVLHSFGSHCASFRLFWTHLNELKNARRFCWKIWYEKDTGIGIKMSCNECNFKSEHLVTALKRVSIFNLAICHVDKSMFNKLKCNFQLKQVEVLAKSWTTREQNWTHFIFFSVVYFNRNQKCVCVWTEQK